MDQTPRSVSVQLAGFTILVIAGAAAAYVLANYFARNPDPRLAVGQTDSYDFAGWLRSASAKLKDASHSVIDKLDQA